MKEIVKEHPLRTIILRFDTSKPITDFEQAALDSYYTEHDKTWEAKRNLIAHKDALFDLDIRITELEYQFYSLEQQLDFLEVGLQIAEHPNLPVIKEDFTINIDDFNQNVIANGNTLNALREDLIMEIDWFNKWGDFIYEHEDWCYEVNSNLISQVFRRYEEVSVDIISLDDDREAFFGAHGEVRKLQKEYFAYGEQVFAMFDLLNERAEKVYRRTERIDEHIERNFRKNKD